MIIHLVLMATITVNVQDDVEKLFRDRVQQRYGKGKGILGRALSEALKEWAVKSEHLADCMQLLEEGRNLGKLAYNHREELHERHRH